MRPLASRPTRRAPAFGAAVLAMTVLAGCSAPAPAPTPTTPVATVTATPTPTPTPTGPTFMPEGSAEDNLPIFTLVTQQVWATPEQVQGRAYIDALIAAGFDKSTMQVTEDMTTVGNPAESIQFSVQWGQECLVGQVGPATGEPVTRVLPALPAGGCLLGDTRPIDW